MRIEHAEEVHSLGVVQLLRVCVRQHRKDVIRTGEAELAELVFVRLGRIRD